MSAKVHQKCCSKAITALRGFIAALALCTCSAAQVTCVQPLAIVRATVESPTSAYIAADAQAGLFSATLTDMRIDPSSWMLSGVMPAINVCELRIDPQSPHIIAQAALQVDLPFVKHSPCVGLSTSFLSKVSNGKAHATVVSAEALGYDGWIAQIAKSVANVLAAQLFPSSFEAPLSALLHGIIRDDHVTMQWQTLDVVTAGDRWTASVNALVTDVQLPESSHTRFEHYCKHTQVNAEVRCDELIAVLAKSLPERTVVEDTKYNYLEVTSPRIHCEGNTILVKANIHGKHRERVLGMYTPWIQASVKANVRLSISIVNGQVHVSVVKSWFEGSSDWWDTIVGHVLNGVDSVNNLVKPRVEDALRSLLDLNHLVSMMQQLLKPLPHSVALQANSFALQLQHGTVHIAFVLTHDTSPLAGHWIQQALFSKTIGAGATQQDTTPACAASCTLAPLTQQQGG